jgi:hypothetical protein
MKNRFQPFLRLLTVASFLFVLASCGGGGGTAETTPNTTAPTVLPAAQAPALIPTASKSGPILYADASVLRPFDSNFVWSYRGTEKLERSSGRVDPLRFYESTTTHKSTGASSFEETTSNGSNTGSDQATVFLRANAIVSEQFLDLDNSGRKTKVEVTELKSPIVAGDIYPAYNQILKDPTFDPDKDGVPDNIEIAIYVEVIGKESLQIPNFGLVETLKTRTNFLVRIQLSSNGNYSDTASTNFDTWYAEKLGVVKVLANYYSPTAERDKRVVEETIIGFSSPANGIGSSVLKNIEFSANQKSRLLNGIDQMFGFKNHTLIFESKRAGDISNTMSAWSIDGAGQVMFVKELSPIASSSLNQYSNGFFYTAARGFSGFKIGFLNEFGEVSGPVEGSSFDFTDIPPGTSVTPTLVAADATTVYMLGELTRSSPALPAQTDRYQLIFQSFNLNGQPKGAMRIVDSSAESFYFQRLQANAGKVVFDYYKRAPGFNSESGNYIATLSDQSSSVQIKKSNLQAGGPIQVFALSNSVIFGFGKSIDTANQPFDSFRGPNSFTGFSSDAMLNFNAILDNSSAKQTAFYPKLQNNDRFLDYKLFEEKLFPDAQQANVITFYLADLSTGGQLFDAALKTVRVETPRVADNKVSLQSDRALLFHPNIIDGGDGRIGVKVVRFK